MSHQITASWDALLQQSSMAADERLHKAILATEDLPEGVDRTALIVAHMQAGQSDWMAACIGVAVQNLCNTGDDIGTLIRFGE